MKKLTYDPQQHQKIRNELNVLERQSHEQQNYEKITAECEAHTKTIIHLCVTLKKLKSNIADIQKQCAAFDVLTTQEQKTQPTNTRTATRN